MFPGLPRAGESLKWSRCARQLDSQAPGESGGWSAHPETSENLERDPGRMRERGWNRAEKQHLLGAVGLWCPVTEAAVRKYCRPSGLDANVLSHVLGARSSRSRCLRRGAPSENSRQASLSWLLAVPPAVSITPGFLASCCTCLLLRVVFL